MREIEQQMIQAIKDGRNWQSGSTGVCRSDSFNYTVKLHGSVIAYVFSYGQGCDISRGDAVPAYDTFRQWPTRTTVSRLRALGINASVNKGVAMIDGVPV